VLPDLCVLCCHLCTQQRLQPAASAHGIVLSWRTTCALVMRPCAKFGDPLPAASGSTQAAWGFPMMLRHRHSPAPSAPPTQVSRQHGGVLLHYVIIVTSRTPLSTSNDDLDDPGGITVPLCDMCRRQQPAGQQQGAQGGSTCSRPRCGQVQCHPDPQQNAVACRQGPQRGRLGRGLR
jgi:hypothetical protein